MPVDRSKVLHRPAMCRNGYAVSDGIIDQLVHRFLVHFVAFAVAARPGRPAHAAIAQQRYPVAGVRIGPVACLWGFSILGCCGTFAVFSRIIATAVPAIAEAGPARWADPSPNALRNALRFMRLLSSSPSFVRLDNSVPSVPFDIDRAEKAVPGMVFTGSAADTLFFVDGRDFRRSNIPIGRHHQDRSVGQWRAQLPQSTPSRSGTQFSLIRLHARSEWRICRPGDFMDCSGGTYFRAFGAFGAAISSFVDFGLHQVASADEGRRTFCSADRHAEAGNPANAAPCATGLGPAKRAVWRGSIFLLDSSQTAVDLHLLRPYERSAVSIAVSDRKLPGNAGSRSLFEDNPSLGHLG